MAVDTKVLFEQAMKLEPEDRAIFAQDLLETVEPAEVTEVARAWEEESEKRLAAYRRGELKTVSPDELQRRLDAVA